MRVHAAVIAALFSSTLAVYADEAYHIDFHYTLLGLPVASNTFFHRPLPESKASLLYTLSDKSVVGAVNPKDGTVVWRHALDLNDTSYPGFLRTASNLDTVISGLKEHVTAWGASDGKLAWKRKFPEQEVRSLDIIEQEDRTGGAVYKDAIVLLGGTSASVQRLDGRTGSIKWKYEDNSGDIAHRISTSTSSLYHVSLQSTLLKGFKIKVTSLDPVTGKKLDQQSHNSDGDPSSVHSLPFVASSAAVPFLVWTDESHKNLKINVLGSKHVSSFDIVASAEAPEINVEAAPGLDSPPHFLVHYQTPNEHWADVFSIDSKSMSIKKIYELPKINGRGSFSASTAESVLYFTRTTEAETILVASTSAAVLGRWPTKSDQRSTDTPIPLHAAAEVVSRSGASFAVRSAILFDNGDWSMVRNGEGVWSRPEALSGIVKAEWAEMNERPSLVEELEIEAQSNIVTAYFHRLKRHLTDLQQLPAQLQTYQRLFLQKIAGIVTSQDISASGDRFGFHKMIIVATENGRLIALDAGTVGQILWNVKAVELNENERWNASSVGSIATRLNSLSNLQAIRGMSPSWLKAPISGNLTLDVLENTSLISDNPHQHSQQPLKLQLLDGVLQCSKERKQIWTFTPGNNQQITSVTVAHDNEPISSIGKVLGDRRVLYKYLNPNVALVISTHQSQPSIIVSLLDTATGTLLYSTTHVHVDTNRPITSAISENWFAYSFTAEEPHDSVSRGYHIVIGELYESSIPNDRGPAFSTHNASKIATEGTSDSPYVVTQVFHIPEEISQMAVTQTQQGITSRQLVLALSGSSAIVSVPRYVLDPRRPVGKDPSTEQMMEGLSKYSPMIEFDPSWYLSHREEILGVKKIIATPALLESTGLVFAYGIDLFGTRVTPSYAFDILGQSFNKVQLVLTVLALFVGTLLAAPFIQRKQTNALWSSI